MSVQKRPARLIAGLTLCCLLAPALLASAQSTQPGQTTILFTLSDKKGKSVTMPLRKEDVRVVEDGEPREVTSLEQRAEQPLSLVMMMDTSVSQERALGNIKTAANEFVSRVAQPGKDSIGVVSFTGKPLVEHGLTSNLTNMRQVINSVRVAARPPYGALVYGAPSKKPTDPELIAASTAIWDSVIYVCEKLLSDAPAGNRRAILLFSDGEDTSSRAKLSDAIQSALKAGVVVYCLVIGDEAFGLDPKTLGKLAEQTGGRAVSPKDIEALRERLAEMGRDLRDPFAVSFLPAGSNRDGSLRKIKIELVNPELRKQGLRLSYQQGYFAR